MTLRKPLYALLAAAVIIAMAACKGSNKQVPASATHNMNNGIDLSHYQGVIDWDELANDLDIGFVYIKASEGTDIRDEMYHYNMMNAHRVGFITGSYHYFIPTVSPVLQFRNFRSMVAPTDIDIVPIVDVETRNNLKPQEFRDSLQIFMDSLEVAYGRKPIIYTLWAFYHDCIQGHFPNYKLMIARYCDQMPVLKDTADYLIWQHKSDGSKMGIKGNVDLNVVTPNHSIKEIMFERALKKLESTDNNNNYTSDGK